MKRNMSIIGLVLVMLLAIVIPASAVTSTNSPQVYQGCASGLSWYNDSIPSGNTNILTGVKSAAFQLVVRDRTSGVNGVLDSTLVVGGWTYVPGMSNNVAISIYTNGLLYIWNNTGHTLDAGLNGTIMSYPGGRCVP